MNVRAKLSKVPAAARSPSLLNDRQLHRLRQINLRDSIANLVPQLHIAPSMTTIDGAESREPVLSFAVARQ
jgi:hypothetical protein